MIRPPGSPGAAFSLVVDGDMRHDELARRRLSSGLGLSPAWAEVWQVHGDAVIEVAQPGSAGEADAMFTVEPGLPLAVFTADCMGIVVTGTGGVGVAHAGWRGMSAGVVAKLLEAMSSGGVSPIQAWLGPTIGPCCFEVGEEVTALFPESASQTTWGTPSVDLVSAALLQLDGLPAWSADLCTRHNAGAFSHRRRAAPDRMVALGWWEKER